MRAEIHQIAYHVPAGRLDNEELAAKFPEWPAARIYEKTGIRTRHIAASSESAADLGLLAAQQLIRSGSCGSEEIDQLILVSQSPDFAFPGSGSQLHRRLGLRSSAGVLDINLGCSGYIYGLSVAKGLVESGQASKVLLVTAETYSKHLREDDKSTRTLFGDGAAATLIGPASASREAIGPFVFGTDGAGADKLLLRHSRRQIEGARETLYMDGPAVFDFAVGVVPRAFGEVLAKANLTMDEIDFVVFHQANRFILEALRKLCHIPVEKYVVDIEEFGNTVSATIPIALSRKMQGLDPGRTYTAVLVGFGVGLSWGCCVARISPLAWQTTPCPKTPAG